MKESLVTSLSRLVKNELKKDLTEEKKIEYLQLLEELKNEKDNPSSSGTGKILISLLKHFASQGLFELFKSYL